MYNEMQFALRQNEWSVAPRQLEAGWTCWWHKYWTNLRCVRVALANEGDAWRVLVQDDTEEGEHLLGSGNGVASLLSLLHSELGDE